MMSEKQFYIFEDNIRGNFGEVDKPLNNTEIVNLLNEQQELVEELHISDHMGWGRAEKFEKELKQKKIYIKRLEYKVQKFKEMNEQLRNIIKQKEEEEQLYAKEILRLNELNKQTSEFTDILGGY